MLLITDIVLLIANIIPPCYDFSDLPLIDKASDMLKMSQEIRSSRAALFFKINVLSNFKIFIEKHL